MKRRNLFKSILAAVAIGVSEEIGIAGEGFRVEADERGYHMEAPAGATLQCTVKFALVSGEWKETDRAIIRIYK